MRRHELPAVPGVLSADAILATGRSIAAMQEPSGAIPWPDGHTDAWDHVECAMALTVCGLTGPARRAYEWLRRTQRADGAWPKRTVRGTVTDAAIESNQVAYVAVGVWHELQVTCDEAFAVRMWPTVRRAITFVLRLQTQRGEILWERAADDSPASYALLTGCSSTYQSLRFAVALAEFMGEPQPDWELAVGQLGHVIAEHPEAFADKSRFSMDWYYPVLGGAVRGDAARRMLASRWAEFVVPDLGIRCVSDEPWITGAETCELVLALDAIGEAGKGAHPLRRGPASQGFQRRLLDRMAVREPGAFSRRAQQLDGGGRRPRGGRAVQGERRGGPISHGRKRSRSPACPRRRYAQQAAAAARRHVYQGRSADAVTGPLQHPQ